MQRNEAGNRNGSNRVPFHLPAVDFLDRNVMQLDWDDRNHLVVNTPGNIEDNEPSGYRNSAL